MREEGLRSGGWMPCAMVPQMRVHRARFCVSSGELPLAPPLAGVHDSQSSRAVTLLLHPCRSLSIQWHQPHILLLPTAPLHPTDCQTRPFISRQLHAELSCCTIHTRELEQT